MTLRWVVTLLNVESEIAEGYSYSKCLKFLCGNVTLISLLFVFWKLESICYVCHWREWWNCWIWSWEQISLMIRVKKKMRCVDWKEWKIICTSFGTINGMSIPNDGMYMFDGMNNGSWTGHQMLMICVNLYEVFAIILICSSMTTSSFHLKSQLWNVVEFLWFICNSLQERNVPNFPFKPYLLVSPFW